MKGVGNELFYDGRIGTLGDIDLWVMPEITVEINSSRPISQKFVPAIYLDARSMFVHMDWPWDRPTVVEIHFVPTMDAYSSVNRKLKRFSEGMFGQYDLDWGECTDKGCEWGISAASYVM